MGTVVLLVLTHPLWLRAMGSALVYDEAPAKADAAVVLAGDYFGNRLLKGIELVKQGYVPVVLVSGPRGYYGNTESDMAIRWAVQQGYPEDWFIAVPHTASSTRDEAVVMLKEIHRRNIHSFLLVTSNFHTARARRLFLSTERRMGGGTGFRVIASCDPYYTLAGWWRTREGLKTAFFEWVKTLTGAVGI